MAVLRAVFATSLFLFVCFASVNGDAICGLDNYDVSSLERRDYWSFNITHEQCGVDNGSCIIYFSVCQPLPSELCGNNSGACQQVIPAGNNTIYHYYSLGKPFENVEELGNNTGFFGYYQNGSNITANCSGSQINIYIYFKCNPAAIWSTQDVTKHFISYGGDCMVLAEVEYSGACVKEDPVISGCNSDEVQHYDLTTMRKPDFWKATVPSSQCKNPFSANSGSVGDDETCDLFFSFCGPLPNGICYNSIFCQINALGKPISYGTFDSNFEINGDADYTGFSISADGSDGQTTDDCPNGFHTVLIFNCSATAIWPDNKNDTNITKFVRAEPNVTKCLYNVVFEYSGACTSYRPKSSSKMSPFGGIIIGLFFGILLLYFVIGAIIQLARGKRGSEIVPNYKQWNLFFILVLEGCQFTLDAVTCFQFRTSHVKHDYEAL